MGRTVPTFVQLIQDAAERWKKFRWALRREDQPHFDRLFVRVRAYTQAATADLMRLRAIDLANSSADIKMGATNTTSLRQQLMNLLQHN